jgi:membrane protein implicated in regulation of membrane protease activity
MELKTITKYFLIQIPGWIVAAILLFWGWRLTWVPAQWALGIFAVWVAKDYIIYPLVRIGYEMNTKTVIEHLIGQRGIAKEILNPKGYVEVRGELWQAEIGTGKEAIPSGRSIIVTTVRGSRLIVSPEDIRPELQSSPPNS